MFIIYLYALYLGKYCILSFSAVDYEHHLQLKKFLLVIDSSCKNHHYSKP